MVRGCFKYRGLLPFQCPQATERRWHHCRGRHCPCSSRRCSGVGAASAPRAVLVSGSPSQTSASPSLTPHHPAWGWPTLVLSWPQPPLTSPGAFFRLSETVAPRCGETTAPQRGDGPLPVLEVLPPRSSCSRVAPHARSHTFQTSSCRSRAV